MMDPDKLFEAMTVDEVKHMLQDTRVNIERKKEELRFLVGERYRDIIEAADTISEMKMSAEKINGSLNRLNQVCQDWHKEIYLNGRVKASTATNDSGVDSHPKYSVAAQIKLLLHMPELLWTAVEHQEHSKAAVLYLSSRHIFTHLQLGGEMQTAKVNALPLVTRQWNSLMQFREVVIRGARASTRKGYTPEAEICDALGSLVLLNDLSLEQVFEEYLSARKSAIEECVNSEDTRLTVKQQICTGLELLLCTVHQIHDLFMLDGDDVSRIQRSLDQSVAVDLISNSELNENIFSHLPSTVSQFRPSLSHIKANLSVECVKEATGKWFSDCTGLFGPAVRNLVSHISALKSLNGIRAGITSTLTTMTVEDAAWTAAASVVLDSHVDLWTGCLKPIFMQRLQVVLEASFRSIFDWLASEVESAVCVDPDGGISALDSFDLNAWLWSEQTADVSIEAVWAAGARHPVGDVNPLGRKFACFTPAIQKLLAALNSRLQSLLEDLTVDDLPTVERAEVQELMTTALQSCLTSFLDWVMAQSDSSLSLPVDCARRRLIFFSRLCLAMSEIFPALRQCLDPGSERSPVGRSSLRVVKPVQASSAWQGVSSRLVQASSTVDDKWLMRVCRRNADRFSETMLSFADIMAFLELCPRWDEVKLEGANIRVPSHASWHIHKLLSDFCQELNAFGAHNIPRSVLLKCVNGMSVDILQSLTAFLADKRKSLGQPQILQLLFDTRFLFSMLSTPDPDQLDSFLRSLEAEIDPFDLDVASGPMQTHVSQLCARCALVYGLLVGLHDRLGALTAIGSTGSALSHAGHEEHHLLARCGGTAIRFVPLPSSAAMRPAPVTGETERANRGSGKKGTHRMNTNEERRGSTGAREATISAKEDVKSRRLKDVYRFGSKLLKSVK